MWMYTNAIDPANNVIRSAMRFWTFAARSRSCISNAGCGGTTWIDRFATLVPPSSGTREQAYARFERAVI